MRVALVTGGSRGIGLAVVVELARRGCDVAVGYVADRAAAASAVAEVEGLGRRAVAVQGDVADPAVCERMVAETVERLGRLDVLVANAGVLVNAPFLDTTPEEYDRVLAVNARGSFFVAQAAARRMIAQGGGGRIVFVTSEAAEAAFPGIAVYCMSKVAQKMAMMAAATELGAHGITVNAVAPGTTETDLNRELLRNPEMRAALLSSSKLGRPGEPQDSAEAVAYLASDAAKHVTGATIAVNGGSLIR